jgi:hypothetical protein
MRYDDIPKLTTWKTDTSVLRKSASGSVLDKIDADIDNYHKAYQPMTKRTLLTDLGYSIRKWEGVHGTTVTFHPVIVALKEVIARRLALLTPSAFKYRQVTCLAFNIGCNTAGGKYFRFSKNDAGDMRGKCHEMMHAIRHAHSVVANSGVDNDETLKIFMGPEFYFRGANGAYSYDLVEDIIPSMKKLGTDEDIFKHWMFVFGTAIAAHEDEVNYCTVCGLEPNTVIFNRDPGSSLSVTGIHNKTQGVCKRDAAHPLALHTYGAEVQNVALIQKGADTHAVVKEYFSDIDYKADKVTVIEGTKKNPQAWSIKVIGPQGGYDSRIVSKFMDERMGGGVFTMDGITFGMEICLDHIQDGPGGRVGNFANTIQVLLIPSYGMTITHHSCTVGGVIFNVDGRGTGTSEVVVKGSTAPIVGAASAAGKTRGQIEKWGPFVIPRRA